MFEDEVAALKVCSLFSLFLTRQVEIVLESIIGRTVEQSMTEVQHEEELLRARSVDIIHIYLSESILI